MINKIVITSNEFKTSRPVVFISFTTYIYKMLEVHQLTKKFSKQIAVEKISFEVKEKEKLILLGTSGSGKSTCLKMINRLIEPTQGEIRLNGENILAQQPEKLRRNMGYIIQNTGLFPHYTVAQNIGLVPNLLKWEKKKIKERSQELLAMLQLPPEEYLHRYPHELSGGQRQRVGIARALAANPPLLLMDEPFGALDPITRAQIQQDFQEIDTLKQKTLIMVTHDVFEAVHLGTTICLLDAGKIQQIGSPFELVFKPQNQFVLDFFEAARFQLELQVVKFQEIAPYLSQTNDTTSSSPPTPHFDEQSSILSILEKTTTQPTPIFIKKSAREMISTSKEAILNAFYKWKEHLP